MSKDQSMTERDASTAELCARVLDLDAKATAGPWEEDSRYDTGQRGGPRDSIILGPAPKWRAHDQRPRVLVDTLNADESLDENERQHNGNLIAEYRTAAPEIARRLIASEEKLKRAEGMRVALTHCLGLLCETGDLNNYRNLSNDELGAVWVATAKEAASALTAFESAAARDTPPPPDETVTPPAKPVPTSHKE